MMHKACATADPEVSGEEKSSPNIHIKIWPASKDNTPCAQATMLTGSVGEAATTVLGWGATNWTLARCIALEIKCPEHSCVGLSRICIPRWTQNIQKKTPLMLCGSNPQTDGLPLLSRGEDGNWKAQEELLYRVRTHILA